MSFVSAEGLDSSKIVSESSSRKNRKGSMPDGRKWSGSSYQREAELRTNHNSSSRSYTSARKKHNGESPSIDTSPLKGNSEIIHIKANKNGSRNVERDIKVQKEKSSGTVESGLLTPGTGRGFEESKVSNRRKMDDIKSENIKNLGMGGEEDVSVELKTEKLTDIIGLSLDVKRDINITEKSEKSKVNAVIVHENNAEENRREGNSSEERKVEKSDKETCEEKISEMEEIERDGRQDKNEEEEEEEEKEDVPRRVEVEVKHGDGDKDDSNFSVEIQATVEDRVGRGERDKDEGVVEMEHKDNADGEKDCDSLEDTKGGRGCVTVDSGELSRGKEGRTGVKDDGQLLRADTAFGKGVRTSILDEEDNVKDKDCMEEDGVNIKSESVLKENKFKEGKGRCQRQTESEKKEVAIDRPKSLDSSEEETKRVRGSVLEGGTVCESGGKLQESRTMERKDKSLGSEEVKARDEPIAGMEPEDEEMKKEVKLEEIEDECLLREMVSLPTVELS